MIRLQSQYFGSLPYWLAIAQNKNLVIDTLAHFEKQSYRNRTMILGPNGPQALIVPIFGRNKKQAFKDVRISYEEPWVRVHLNSLQSAYRSAPYFEYLYPDMERILNKQHVFLMELNLELLQYFITRMKLGATAQLAETYDLLPTEQEARDKYHPKTEIPSGTPYPQVFLEKFGFVPGLGIIDLLMNDLTGAASFFRKQALH